MKLSTRARYGLRALIDLGLYGETEAVSIQSIADREHISDSYLEQLMGRLKKAGLVVSSRGVLGGYRLARPASKISVGEVLTVLEGGLDAVVCPGLSMEEGETCIDADCCVTKMVWKRINDGIKAAVDTLWLEELIDESRRIRQSHPVQEIDERKSSCSS